MSDSVKFTTTAGEPTIIHVTDEDGKRYDLKIQLVIFEVVKTSEKNAASGTPIFQAKARLMTDTSEVET